MSSFKAAKCHVRYAEEKDFLDLEQMYREHEGHSLPKGYFSDYQTTLRNNSVTYLVATVDGRVVGGGGIANYIPGNHAALTFGIVAPSECRKGYGTSILLSRLLYVDPRPNGCQINLQATEWSAHFFRRLGFSWYGKDQDDEGNRFLFGTQTVNPGDEQVFQRILKEGGVTLGFQPDRPTLSSE